MGRLRTPTLGSVAKSDIFISFQNQEEPAAGKAQAASTGKLRLPTKNLHSSLVVEVFQSI